LIYDIGRRFERSEIIMKKILKVALLVVIAFALILGKGLNTQNKSNTTPNNEVTLVDFDNSGDPEFVSLY
jgi:hypothetical protein